MARWNELTQGQKHFAKEVKSALLSGFQIARPGDPSTDMALDIAADVAHDCEGFPAQVAGTVIQKKKMSEKQAFIIAMGLFESNNLEGWKTKFQELKEED
jgi:hypothetical protein